MERLLRGKKPIEIKSLFNQSFDLGGPVVLFPVRHHSPACAYHLRQTIAAYKPEVVLIEGPENAQLLIEDLTKEGNKPPFCIYLSYDDSQGLLGEAQGKYRAYYPMLAYSPELNALLEAKQHNIPCEFIDLSYQDKLYNQQNVDSRLEEGQEDDRLFTISGYYKCLTEKMNCKNFNDLWEKLFELPAFKQTTAEFVENVFTYCYYSRTMTPLSELTTTGDLAREQYMRQRIHEAQQKYKKILVVTGGIHTIALTTICSPSPQETSTSTAEVKEQKSSGLTAEAKGQESSGLTAEVKDQELSGSTVEVKDQKLSTSTTAVKVQPISTSSGSSHQDINVSAEEDSMQDVVVRKLPGEMPPTYLMPYSFEASDQNSGYEAGMVFPYFYQKVWELHQKKKKSPYEEAVLSFIINVANKMRKKQALSITDEMQSFYMAKGLAELREKPSCGVFELIDAVQSSFVKGQINAHYEPVLDELFKLLTGMEMGRVTDTKNIPPIVIDFLEQCKTLKITTQSALAKEAKLNVANKEEHRQKSYFFHQMAYLGTDFCTYEKGQDERTGVGRILLTETWKYRYTPKVQATLIDQCVYGGNVRSACIYLLTKEMKDTHQTAATLSEHFLQAEKMGIHELYSQLQQYLNKVLSEDMDFLSVAVCFENLTNVLERMKFRQRKEIKEVEALRNYTLQRMRNLMPTVENIPKDQEDLLCNKLKFIYECFIEESLIRDEDSTEEVDAIKEEHYIEETASIKEADFIKRPGFSEREQEWLETLKSVFNNVDANSALVGTCSGILLRREQLSLETVMDKLAWYLQGSQKAKKQSAAFLKGFFKIAKDTAFIEPRLLKLIDDILRDTQNDEFLEILPDLRLAFTYFLPFEIDKIAKQVAKLYGLKEQTILQKAAISPQLITKAKEADHTTYLELIDWFKKGELADGRTAE